MHERLVARVHTRVHKRWVASLVRPLHSLRATGREVMIGTVGVGLAQAALATFGYLVTGAPDPAFYGAMTAVSSLIPGIGTLIVWVPMGIYLIVTGHVAGGVALLLIGPTLVGFAIAVLKLYMSERRATRAIGAAKTA